jgi:hypothetical protein
VIPSPDHACSNRPFRAWIAARFEDLTTSPRRYGFHGTLKAPFSLAKDATEDALIAACTGFAKTVSPFDLKGLSVNQLGKFLALTPAQAEPDLEAFASLCVRQFEPFRAPLSAEDLDRRRQANLTPKQDAYVETWGYPYVFDEFRFHMTLSNKLETTRRLHSWHGARKRILKPSPIRHLPVATSVFMSNQSAAPRLTSTAYLN